MFTMLAAVLCAQTLEMEPVTLNDPMAIHRTAITFLKPKGWTVAGGLKWYLNHSHQVCLESTISNPNSLEQVETLAWSYLTWVTNPLFPMQPGSNYMGNVVLPPIEDPREVVRTITIPTIRKNARIVGYQEMPELAKTLAKLNDGKVRSGKIRIEYDLAGRTVEEDIYLSLFHTSYNQGGQTFSIWGPAWPPFSLRAEKGKLDQATPTMLAIINSAKVEPRWFAEVQYVKQLFRERMAKGIQNAVDLSKTIRENSDAIFKMYSESYWNQQASQAKLSQNFSDTIRGVQNYQSPFANQVVQLPNSHPHVWAGSNGSYILTHDSNLDPNQGSNQTWKKMQASP